MSLSCDCGDYDSPAFFQETTQKARKTHKCCECGREIPAGMEYQKVRGKWDGEIAVFKTCERCQMIRETLQELGYCISFGGLIEDFQDYLSMTRATRTAREILCEV